MKKDRTALDIPDPHKWIYRVTAFYGQLGQLQIELNHIETKEKLYLNFIGVEFFDEPFDWSRQGFSSGSAEECLSILQKMEAHQNASTARLLEDYMLYVVTSEYGHRIRCVASRISILSLENEFPEFA